MRSMIMYEYRDPDAPAYYAPVGEEQIWTEDPETIAMATFIAADIISEDTDDYPAFSDMKVDNMILIDSLEQFRTLAKNSGEIIYEVSYNIA